MECPFIDGADERCSRRLTLSNIQQAVSLCAHDYLSCPVYRALRTQAVRRGGQSRLRMVS